MPCRLRYNDCDFFFSLASSKSNRHRRLSCSQNVFICYYFKLYFFKSRWKKITFSIRHRSSSSSTHTQNTFSWHLMKMKLACLMDIKKRTFDVVLSRSLTHMTCRRWMWTNWNPIHFFLTIIKVIVYVCCLLQNNEKPFALI